MNLSTPCLLTEKNLTANGSAKTITQNRRGLNMMRWVSLAIFAMIMMSANISTAQLYWGGTAAQSWTSTSGTRWGTVEPTYNTTWITNSAAVFNVANSTITGATTNFSSITANENVTVTPANTLGTNGTVATITVASGKTLDFSSQNFSTSAGTGFIKAGAGTMISSNGNTYPGGFTMNAGTMIVGGVNAMGNGGALNINGGTLATVNNRNITARYTGINIGGNFTFGNTGNAANFSFADNVSLGASSTRTITIGATGTYTFSGIVSGSGSSLVVASTAAGILNLSGANTFNGTITVNGGTLQSSGATSVSAASSITVNSGGTLRISANQTLTNITVNSGGTLLVDAGVTLTLTGTNNISGTLQTAGTVTNNGTLNINGTGVFQIDQGGFGGGSNDFTYAAGSTLIYNYTQTTAYGPVTATHRYWPASGPTNVILQMQNTNSINAGAVQLGVSRTISGTLSTKNANGRTMFLDLNGNTFQAANLTVGATGGTTAPFTITGTTVATFTGDVNLNANFAINGDIKVGGNWTKASSSVTFSPNTKAVFFNGPTGDQTIAITGGGTESFAYLIVDKATSGNVKLSSSPATNVSIASTAGSVLQINNNGGLDLNGQTFTLSGTGGNLLTSGGTRVISNSNVAEATFNMTGAKTVTSASGGTLIFDTNVKVALGAGTDFGSSITTINGTLQLNAAGGASSSPIFGSGANLIYNGAQALGSPFVTSFEWPTTSGPTNVTIQNNTNVALSNNYSVAGNFTINVASSSLRSNSGFKTLSMTGGIVASPKTFDASGVMYGEFGGNTLGINFNGATQLSGSTGYLDAKSYVVNGTLICNTIGLNSNSSSPSPGQVTIAAGGTLKTRNTAGLWDGATLNPTIRFNGTAMNAPIIDAASTVDYNRTAGGQTVSAVTYGNLVFSNTSGNNTLGGNATAVTIDLGVGTVTTTSSYTLAVSSSATGAVTTSGGYVIGKLQRAIATGTNSYTYQVGTATGYTPATIAFNSVSTGGNVSVSGNDGVSGNYPAALSSTKRLARYWTAVNSGIGTFTADVQFNYFAADLTGGASETALRSYQFTSPSTTAYPTTGNAGPGVYTFTVSGVTDLTEFGAGECKGTLAPTFTKTMASACGGGVDGTITVTPVGGTGPFTYSWTGPGGFTASTAAITGLGSGDYTVTVKEVSGCSVTIPNITIWQALAPVLTSSYGGSSSCANSGSIFLYGSYGVPPFQYSIDGSTYQSGNSFTGLSAGTYTGYVKDFAGCITTKPGIIITAAAAIVVTSYTRPASSCANNGSIELYRTGGIPPYTYSLNDVTYQGSNTFTNLAGATTYTGWVKDAAGCKTSLAGIVVAKAPAVTVTSTHGNTSACATNGYINLVAGGGVPGYTYSLTGAAGPYQASSLFTGLAAGTYNGWVQDSKGCKNVQFGIVVGTDAAATITVTASAHNSSGCTNTGSIQVFRTGGVGPYTYSLDNITYQAGNLFSSLGAGTYTAWVKDARGCTGSLTNITITAASAVSVTESHTNTSSCTNDGTIQLRPAGGVVPYTYSLDNITYQAGSSFLLLGAGTYTGWVKDANGCTASVSGITISANPGITVTAYAGAASNCETSNGVIQLFRTGGVGPYTYSLDNVTYVSSNLFTGKMPGTYTGYVKDSRGCVGTLADINIGPICFAKPPVAVNSASKVSANNDILSVLAYPNPSTDAFTLVLTGANKDKVVITVTDVMGRKVYQSETTGKNQLVFGSDLKTGIYLVQVVQGDKKQSIKIIKE